MSELMLQSKKDMIESKVGSSWSTMGLTVEKISTGYKLSSIYDNSKYIAYNPWDAVCFISGLQFGLAGEVIKI